MNSPGGDMFEGIAIYNMLLAHPANVTIEVLGWAASAASILAMAGDRIRMGVGTTMMVHNAWGVVIGNRHDMSETAQIFEGFDAAIAEIYAARTGLPLAKIAALMDAESYMSADEAVAHKFADEKAGDIKALAGAADEPIHAKRRLDAMLAKTGVPRAERRRMLREVSGTHDAADTPDDGLTDSDVLNYLWQPAIAAGQPETLLGYALVVNEDVNDIGANAYPIAFGNWRRGYIVIDRMGVTLLRDNVTKKGWVNFYFTKRVGGAPADTRAIKLLKIATS